MTVKELKELIANFPDDAIITRDDAEWGWEEVTEVYLVKDEHATMLLDSTVVVKQYVRIT